MCTKHRVNHMHSSTQKLHETQLYRARGRRHSTKKSAMKQSKILKSVKMTYKNIKHPAAC